MESPIVPLVDKVVIKPIEEEESTYGNLIIPDMGKEKPTIGVVAAVGPGRTTESGTFIEMNLEEGDKVLVPNYGAAVVQVEGEEYIIAREPDILGKIKNKTNE